MSNEQLTVNYQRWGRANGNNFSIKTASNELTEQALSFIKKEISIGELKLVSALDVSSYRGHLMTPVELILLRFSRSGNLEFGNEHFTILFDWKNNRIQGITNMIYENESSSNLLSHDKALRKAINFLMKFAPDLVPRSTLVDIPKITPCSLEAKLNFDEKARFGSLELHWINKHKEELNFNGTRKEMWGMKVKMYMPHANLWVWVILDYLGHVQTFERDIFWNFSDATRETQMWLHDSWLQLVLNEKGYKD